MSSYTPTTWKTGDKISSAGLNNIEQGIAAFYPQETIIAPEQTVTITDSPAAITLADGYALPEELPNNWAVTVDGNILTYDDHGIYTRTDTTQSTPMSWQVVMYNGELQLVVNAPPNGFVPGDYTVKITKGAPARIPAVVAFPVSAGSGDDILVIDAPKEDVDAAMANGCVLLYAADPYSDAGFAFGCLVGNAMYYYAAFRGELVWNADTVILNGGKYVVQGES